MARKIRKEKYSVAIIGEGPTEWHYFNGMRIFEKFDFTLKPDLPSNSDFKDIIEKAKYLIKQGYDEVICVIDLDTIVTNELIFNKYLSLRNQVTKRSENIKFCENMPCFEIWLLLHFKRTSRILQNYNELRNILIKFIPDYEKTEAYYKRNNFYEIHSISGRLEIANDNANWLLEEKKRNPNDLHPYTQVHLAINHLKRL